VQSVKALGCSVRMPARKMRVEVFDEDGNRYTITFEGEVTREKALQILNIVELLGGVHDTKGLKSNVIKVSKFEKTKAIIEKYFNFTWFSSKDVFKAYEQEFNELISLSTVSTYLARLVNRGFLTKQGPSHSRKYRKITKLAQNNLWVIEDK
jgi:hypothetical protein